MKEIAKQVETLFEEIIEAGKLKKDDIIALGCSTSEVIGGQIGKLGSFEVGKEIVQAALKITSAHGIHLAVQGCEHINRALVVSGECVKKHGLELVTVRPTPSAGGSAAAAAYEIFENAVVAEHIKANAGIDIGDTHIGMQVKFVQVPYRPKVNQIGTARVTALTSRPKLIGGARAEY